MGFVSKLFTIFIPIIVAMIFYYQRDHILGKANNDWLEEHVGKFGNQLNYHLDAIKQQIDQFVTESKDIVGVKDQENEIANDEVNLNKAQESKKNEKKNKVNDQVKDEVKVDKVKVDEVKVDEVKVDEKILNQKKIDEKITEKVSEQKVKKSTKCDLGKDLLITKEQLSQYNGEDPKKKIYLSFLGIVYDVSKGEQHYAPGGAYSMFTGKDASRAFITGDFSEAGLIDDLTGLKSESFSGVSEWADFYEKTYRRVGRLIGAFYDKDGCATEQVRFIEDQLEKAKQNNQEEQYENDLFPPCNLEYDNQKKETRFWCTKQSGGIQRDWTGVPRKLFNLKNKSDFRCACVRDFGPENAIEYDDEVTNVKEKKKDVGDLNNPRVREFENCPAKATECLIKDK